MEKTPPPAVLSRREIVKLALAAPILGLASAGCASGAGVRRAAAAGPLADLDLASVAAAPGRVVPAGGGAPGGALRLERAWDGALCRSQLVNGGRQAVRVKEVVLFELSHALPADTRLYGEGFQMLSQTAGTLGQPADVGNFTDAKHYRLPRPDDGLVLYGMMSLAPPSGGHRLLAFTSCRRFSGQFQLRPGRLEVVVDTEGLELLPGQRWQLEELIFAAGPDREALLDALARRVRENHPPLAFAQPPSGWCSWYCFGPRVTAQNILDNLDAIAQQVPGLKYIQVDDGYQPAMGDWLDTGNAFGGDVQGVLKAIRRRGFEPAIWVAPFIAEAGSQVFQRHPDWFVEDADGRPLPSDRVTFAGWRRGPWYVLDGTHPEVQEHFEALFRTMRTEWGCTYFKLDANFWGAIHGGRFHDRGASRVEAYRRGMEAVRRGAGEAFLLGCNHPIWASFGLVHGSRSSNDIKRTWSRIETTARQNLLRNWQNGRLWWNDPDVVVLTGELGEEEFRFHATAIHATGGMLLSGDDLTQIQASRLEMLRKLQPPTGVAARFGDDRLEVGTIELPDRRVVCLLNWGDAPRTLAASVPAGHHVRELWTGQDLGRPAGGELSLALPPRSGRVLVCTPKA